MVYEVCNATPVKTDTIFTISLHHHHHVMPLARISLTLSRHFSLSFIASGRSSGLHPVSSHSCCIYVRAGHLAFAWPYARVHRSTSLMSSSLLLQQCPACLVHLTWIVFVMGGRLVNSGTSIITGPSPYSTTQLRKYLWCNCHCHRKWTQQHEFKSWMRLIVFHIELIPLGKV